MVSSAVSRPCQPTHCWVVHGGCLRDRCVLHVRWAVDGSLQGRCPSRDAVWNVNHGSSNVAWQSCGMGKGCEQEAGEAIVAEIDADVGAPIRVYDKDDPRRERQGGQQNQGSLQRTPTRERWHEVHAFSLTMMLSQYGQRTYGPSAMLTGSPVAVTM